MTGVVKVAKHKSTGEPFAVKSINYSCLDPAQYGELINEIRILKTLEHPNVVRLKETYQNDKSIVLVMEYLTGGDLSKRRLKTEYDVIRVIGEVLSGLQYCHSKGIVHRDLKLQNIVFASPDEDSAVKIIDFGLSRPYLVDTSRRGKKERIFTTQCGTVAYMSPEILKGRYTKSCDLWAVGVIMYALLTNRAPFGGDDDEVVKQNILAGRVNYKNPIWKRLHKAALPLVKGLLQVDPEKRLTAEKALESPWFGEWRQSRMLLTKNTFVSSSRFLGQSGENGGASGGTTSPKLMKPMGRKTNNKGAEINIDDTGDDDQVTLDFAVAQSLKQFSSYSKIKKLAMMIIAHHLPQKKLGELQTAFLAFDENGSGTISLEEFKKLLARHGPVSDEEAAAIFKQVDQDGKGEVDYPEFLAATIEIFGNFNTQALLDAFNHLDIHNTGLITKEGLSELAGGEMDEEEIQEIIREADTSKDGKVSKEEFLQAMLKEVNGDKPVAPAEGEEETPKDENKAQELAKETDTKEKPQEPLSDNDNGHDEKNNQVDTIREEEEAVEHKEETSSTPTQQVEKDKVEEVVKPKEENQNEKHEEIPN